MLQLTVQESPGLDVRLDAIADRRVALYDAAGVAVAYTGEYRGGIWVEVPDVGMFHLTDGSRVVTASVDESVGSDTILDTFHGTVLPLVIQATCGVEVVHGGAVVVRSSASVVAFCGPSGAGKSTVSYGLAALGHTQWADDAVAFRVDRPAAITAVALPFTPKLRPASAAYFGASPPAATGGGRPGPQTARLRAVFLLDRAGSADVRPSIAQLEPAEAMRALLPNAYRFQPQSPASKRQTLRAYLDLVGTVPVLHVRFPNEVTRLPELFEALERSIGSVA